MLTVVSHIGEVIQERSKLLVQTPEAMEKRFNIKVKIFNEVLSINHKNKTVEVKNHKTGEVYNESYDNLVLSPGANPIKPPIPGIDHKNIFTLRNIPDTDKIKSFVDNKKPQSAVVVGGGFIGLEMAENLHHRGLNVTLVEMTDQVMAPIDFEMAAIVHDHIRSKNVNLVLNDGVKSFADQSGRVQVTLESGKQVTADLVIFAIGVRPETTLAKSCGLELGERGGIKVNEYLQTSDLSIYAIGDAIEVNDFVTGKKAHIPLTGPANKQGRIIANNISDRSETYKGTQGTAVAKVFDLTVASTGANEKTLKRDGIEYIASGSHAGYYPGAIPMAVKILFTPKGKLRGGQIIGYNGVDKRMDVLATCIRFGKSIFDLQEIELSYAPPFSSAKDPINMAGYAAGNILTEDTNIIHWHEIATLDPNKSILVNVRTKMENDLGTIEGSYHIPVDDLRKRLNELPKDREIIIFCQVGLRGYIATRILKQHGFTKVRNLSGGYKTYKVVSKEIKTQNNSSSTPSESSCCCHSEMQIKNDSTSIKRVALTYQETVKLDACGLQCPGPIMQVYQKINTLEEGQILEVNATDPGFVSDIPVWCKSTGNTLIKQEKGANCFIAYVQKGSSEKKELTNQTVNLPQDKTMVIFSGDLNKAIASFIIANGTASMGRKVTLFFTFWGLNILRKNQNVKVKKVF